MAVAAAVFSGTLLRAMAAGEQAGAVSPEKQKARVERGAHLVATMGCDDCHTPMKMGPHGPEKDLARRLTGLTVVATATHRQRKIRVTRCANGRLNVLGRPTVNHRMRHGTDRLCPNSGCRRVAIAALYRYIARHLLAESAQRLSDHVHYPTPVSR